LKLCEGVSLGLGLLSIGEFARLAQVSPRMLRHYDQLGLLRPERVDPDTSYRAYSVGQLTRLHKLLALRDLGFTLEQIGVLLGDEPPTEQIRGMLRLRQAQIEETLAAEHARLRRVEAHLRAIEGSKTMSTQNVVLKHTEPLRVAEAVDTAAGLGPEAIGPVFTRLVPKVLAHLERAGARPRTMIGHYEEPAEDGSVQVHVGFDIGDQPVDSDDGVRVLDLPVVEVASVIHQGSMDNVQPVYEALVRWIDDSGYRLAGYSRELYLDWCSDDPDQSITELQVPIAK
jgi:DNA-binding transcriptional MerR regulator